MKAMLGIIGGEDQDVVSKFHPDVIESIYELWEKHGFLYPVGTLLFCQDDGNPYIVTSYALMYSHREKTPYLSMLIRRGNDR